MKILMVCLGNICRSPMAEGIMKNKVEKHDLDVEVDSAGFEAFHEGNRPDRRGMATLKKYGIDISNQRSRLFNLNDFNTFDHIYVMDGMNHADVMSVARNEDDKKKVNFILNKIFPGENRHVPDPYYGSGDGFERVYEMLDKACDVIVNELKTK